MDGGAARLEEEFPQAVVVTREPLHLVEHGPARNVDDTARHDLGVLALRVHPTAVSVRFQRMGSDLQLDGSQGLTPARRTSRKVLW